MRLRACRRHHPGQTVACSSTTDLLSPCRRSVRRSISRTAKRGKRASCRRSLSPSTDPPGGDCIGDIAIAPTRPFPSRSALSDSPRSESEGQTRASEDTRKLPGPVPCFRSPIRKGECVARVLAPGSYLVVLCYVADFACHDIRRRIPSSPRTHDALDRGSMDFDPDSGYLTKHY